MNLFEMLASVNRPKCAAVDQMHKGLREKMDQAIISHDPPCLRDVMIQFQVRSNGVPQSTFYHYARRLRAHAKYVECTQLGQIEGVPIGEAMTALLDGELVRIFTSDGEPKDPDDGYDPAKPWTMDDKAYKRIGQITLYQNRLSRTLINRKKLGDLAQRNRVDEAERAIDDFCAQANAKRRAGITWQPWHDDPDTGGASPATSPATPASSEPRPSGSATQTIPTQEVTQTKQSSTPAVAQAPSLPPLARGDQGGVEIDIKEPAPATISTSALPQPPNAPTPVEQRSAPHRAHPRTHKLFGGGPWKPRIDPEIEDAEDRANKKAGRPIPFDFDP